MQYILTKMAFIVAILSGLAVIYGGYNEVTSAPAIEIKTLSSDKLTILPSLDGLNANYTYKSKPINSLWKLSYLISNIGNKTIIGEGNNKNIIKDNIKFSLGENFKILELHSSDDKKNVFKIDKIDESTLYMSFLQWRPNENINLIIYAEQLNNKNKPNLITSDREIINAQVQYTSFQDEIYNNKLAFFYQLPQSFQAILKWFSFIFYGTIVTIMPLIWLNAFIKNDDLKSMSIGSIVLIV